MFSVLKFFVIKYLNVSVELKSRQVCVDSTSCNEVSVQVLADLFRTIDRSLFTNGVTAG